MEVQITALNALVLHLWCMKLMLAVERSFCSLTHSHILSHMHKDDLEKDIQQKYVGFLMS